MMFDSGQNYCGRAYRDCIASAHAHHVAIVIRGAGCSVALDILAPSLPFIADTGDDINENSIVVMLHHDNFENCSWAMPVKRVSNAF
jgi:hypothetical protein